MKRFTISIAASITCEFQNWASALAWAEQQAQSLSNAGFYAPLEVSEACAHCGATLEQSHRLFTLLPDNEDSPTYCSSNCFTDARHAAEENR